MTPRVIKIEKSKTFGQEINGEKRYIAVVSLVKSSENGNKFVSAMFGTNQIYKASLDLSIAYCDDDDAKDEEGNFSPSKAFKLLKEQFTPDGIGLYDIDLGKTYIVKETKREMSVARIALFGSEEEAKKYAFRSLERDLKAKRIVEKVEEESEDEEE